MDVLQRLIGIDASGDLSPVHKIPNGSITIRNLGTGDHRTFRVRTQAPEARFAPNRRILSILTGPRNEHDYTGIAFINDDGVQVWKRHRDTEFEALAKFFWRLLVNEEHGSDYDIFLEKRCLVCNRLLTEPESIVTGIGPVCADRLAEREGIDPRLLKARRLKAKLEGRF